MGVCMDQDLAIDTHSAIHKDIYKELLSLLTSYDDRDSFLMIQKNQMTIQIHPSIVYE